MELGICDNAILDSQAKFDVEVPPTVWSIDEMGLNYACLNSLTFLDYRKSAILNSEDALRDFIIRMFKVEYQDMKITRLTDIQREKRLAIDKFGEDFHNDLDVSGDIIIFMFILFLILYLRMMMAQVLFWHVQT